MRRRIAVAGSAVLLATVLSSYAIAHAQAGPYWEVPVAIVSLLSTTQALSFALIAVAIGLAAGELRATHPSVLSILALFAQVILAVVLAVVATPATLMTKTEPLYNPARQIVTRAPEGFGDHPAKYRYDVIFLKEPLTASAALKSVPTKQGVDRAHAGSGVLYFSRLIRG